MLQCAAACLALKTDRRAASALEYGMIAGIIVATIALGFSSLADALSNQYVSIGGNL
jgi:Flp pilus assembly pilin Flp